MPILLRWLVEQPLDDLCQPLACRTGRTGELDCGRVWRFGSFFQFASLPQLAQYSASGLVVGGRRTSIDAVTARHRRTMVIGFI